MMFVYDLETTGLKTHKCEIIERYVHEMTHDVQFSSGVIKAKSKVPPLVINLTGITQIEVNNGENLSVFAKEMTNILNICYKPTFIAHNGNAFDHQIMRYQNLLNNNCNFLDSKSIIGQLSVQKTGGETLGKAYELVIGYKFKGNAHRARADVMMLLEIFKKLNVSEKDLLRML
jgi:DNA polymerase III alpha subunit (gram-positive type)